MALEGPHCTHDECSWTHCDHVLSDNDADAILYFCRHVRDCGLCGPASDAWPRLVKEWTEWVIGWCGADELTKLRELGVQPNVVEIAELIVAHPVAGR